MTVEPRVVSAQPLRYLLSVPAAVDARPPAGWPLCCFLHGYDEAAPSEIREALTRHGPLRPGSPSLAERCVVVAPQLPTAGDLWHRWSDAVQALVALVEEAHGTDARRRYLTGFSFGGNGVFDLALLQPRRWAALWAVDPTRPAARVLAEPVWLSVGQVTRRRLPDFLRALALHDADGPAGATGDRLYRDQGEDHVGSARRAYHDAQIHEWLLARRLPERD